MSRCHVCYRAFSTCRCDARAAKRLLFALAALTITGAIMKVFL